MTTLTQTEIGKFQQSFADETDRLAGLLDALGDRNRLRIVMLFSKQCNICVSDVARILDISVPAASQQLKTLEMRGIVEKEKQGQMSCYKIKVNDPLIQSLLQVVERL